MNMCHILHQEILKNILKQNKFKLILIKQINYHGGSLRSVAVKNNSNIYKENYNRKIFKKFDKIYNLNFFQKNDE